MTVGDERREVGPGDAIYIPSETRHTLKNIGDEPIKLLLVCGPAFFYEDEVRDQAPDLEGADVYVKDLLIRGGTSMLKVGEIAPEFTVRAHTGEEVSLAGQRGKTVILWFYPKADTPG